MLGALKYVSPTCVDFKGFEDQVSKWVVEYNFSFWNAYNTNCNMVRQMSNHSVSLLIIVTF